MLELTGRKADGWLPTKMTPGQYQASLKTIEAAAGETGRDPAAITPAMLGYVLLGPDEETVQRLTEQPLVRALCVLLPAAVFRELGVEPPLAAAGSGFHDFIPTEVGRGDALRIVAPSRPRWSGTTRSAARRSRWPARSAITPRPGCGTW